jgi:hypothetical protein
MFKALLGTCAVLITLAVVCYLFGQPTYETVHNTYIITVDFSGIGWLVLGIAVLVLVFRSRNR